MAKKKTAVPAQSAPKNEFIKLIGQLSHRHQIWRVFADFCEISALSLTNAVIKDEAREQRYLDLVKGYTAEELQILIQLLALTVIGLEDLEGDFLGEMFQSLELSSHWHGQFFTPMPVCQAMAAMTVHDIDDQVEQQGFITVCEPACGAGAMVLGLAAAMRAKGLNPQTQMHVTAVDIDATAAHMCFIQLSLCGIPAAVWIGNTLSNEMHECFLTPFHHLGLWDTRLAFRRHAESLAASETVPVNVPELETVLAPEPEAVYVSAEQLSLFEIAAV